VEGESCWLCLQHVATWCPSLLQLSSQPSALPVSSALGPL
jgi:hypothetical protein